MRRTAVYRNDLFLEHQPGFDHVESPERLKVIYDELDKDEIGRNFVFPAFNPASLEIIGLNHTPDLIKRVAETAGRRHDFLDVDTQTSARSFDAACLAVGALINGIRRIFDNEIDNGFCLVRPPGHHAERDRSMGFCLFNNVAVAARWALSSLGLQRILIVDWDLHHGNGTQDSFYDSDKVLYCSTHQYPYYPGTGAVLETGTGKGLGFTVNVPLPGGQGDRDFVRIYKELFSPIARLYNPQLILVSCGFDIYRGDPLGAMHVTTAGFAMMTRIIVNLAEELCNGRVLVTLEGGYKLTGMRDGALAVLTELYGETLNSGYPDFSKGIRDEKSSSRDTPPLFLEQAIGLAKRHWSI